MPEVDKFFKKFDVNLWSYEEFQKFKTAEKSNKNVWINSLKAIIKKDNNYPVRCRKKANYILNNHSSVIVVIPSKQSTTIFKIWSNLRKKIVNDRNLLKNNEIHFLSNLFPPASVELDEEVNEYLDNIFSIFKSKETFNSENIFEEVEKKRKLVNLGIKTFKERQITFIFDT
ncbi:19352_t:CDS:2, partial [Gigaspora margarita]